MAYAQSTVTVTPTSSAGRKAWHVVFTETAVGTGSTGTIDGLPETGTITLTRVAPTFVAGTTVQPAFGRTIDWTIGSADINHIGQVSAAAASINEGANLRYSGLVGGQLFYRTKPDAGSDTATAVELLIVDGHI